jgi:hypothetical protein
VEGRAAGAAVVEAESAAELQETALALVLQYQNFSTTSASVTVYHQLGYHQLQ